MLERSQQSVLEKIRDKQSLASVSEMKGRVIVNGGPNYKKREAGLRMIEKSAQKHGISLDVVVTQYPGHAAELGRQAREDKVHVVFINGGDGTAKQVIDEAAKARIKEQVKSEIVYGILPTGTMNVTARALRTPMRDVGQAMDSLLTGRLAPIDLVHMFSGPEDDRLLDEYCIINAGVGQAAKMIEIVEAHGLRGPKGFTRAALKETKNLRPQRVNYVNLSTGNEHELDARIVEASNGGDYGRLFHVLPENASLNDGEIDSFAVPTGRFPLAQTAGMGLYTFGRRNFRFMPPPPGVIFEKGREIAVNTINGEAINGIHGDGEPIVGVETGVIIFQSAPNYVTLLAPQRSEKSRHLQ